MCLCEREKTVYRFHFFGKKKLFPIQINFQIPKEIETTWRLLFTLKNYTENLTSTLSYQVMIVEKIDTLNCITVWCKRVLSVF